MPPPQSRQASALGLGSETSPRGSPGKRGAHGDAWPCAWGAGGGEGLEPLGGGKVEAQACPRDKTAVTARRAGVHSGSAAAAPHQGAWNWGEQETTLKHRTRPQPAFRPRIGVQVSPNPKRQLPPRNTAVAEAHGDMPADGHRPRTRQPSHWERTCPPGNNPSSSVPRRRLVSARDGNEGLTADRESHGPEWLLFPSEPCKTGATVSAAEAAPGRRAAPPGRTHV